MTIIKVMTNGAKTAILKADEPIILQVGMSGILCRYSIEFTAMELQSHTNKIIIFINKILFWAIDKIN